MFSSFSNVILGLMTSIFASNSATPKLGIANWTKDALMYALPCSKGPRFTSWFNDFKLWGEFLWKWFILQNILELLASPYLLYNPQMLFMSFPLYLSSEITEIAPSFSYFRSFGLSLDTTRAILLSLSVQGCFAAA